VNHREHRFVAAYVKLADAERAAREAGYKPSCAWARGTALMQRATIRYAIDRAHAERARRTGLSRERVLLEYARIAFGDLGRVAQWDEDGVSLTPFEEMSDDDAAAIMSLALGRGAKRQTVRVRLHDKGFALEALARYFGLFDEAPPEREVATARERLKAFIAALVPAQG
jgi:phage terminase small subunit